MEQRTNFLALILLDALEDENESDILNILESNSNIDASYVPRERGISPLHYVCGMQNERLGLEMARRFLVSGANPNVRSDENMTPLHVAAIYGRVEVVGLLLQYGAELDVLDDDRKTPVLYAIEECHFEVVQLMRDHIFVGKCKKMQDTGVPLSETRFEHSLQRRELGVQSTSTPQRLLSRGAEAPLKSSVSKNLLSASNPSGVLCEGGDNSYTPNRVHYNYDVTSPYYINITHRRNKPQPKFPPLNAEHQTSKSESSVTFSPELNATEAVNIFTLTQENIRELTNRTAAGRSRLSMIEMWREKVKRSRARQSVIRQFDDIGAMIDEMIEHDHLNFTNVGLKENPKDQLDTEADSGACGSGTSSQTDITEYNHRSTSKHDPPQISLDGLIPKVAQVQLHESKPNSVVEPRVEIESESSYLTVPEIMDAPAITAKELCDKVGDTPNGDTPPFIRSPKNDEYFLQMTEAYVHTDDENGLVFYETKLLSNQGNKVARQRSPTNGTQRVPGGGGNDLNNTMTTESTNLTIPLDYETDALRAELTTFGEPPGPITKSTKRLYIKRLIKYKRKTAMSQEWRTKQNINESKFSVELQRTIRSAEHFQRIQDYMKFENQLMLYFANNNNKKKLREGHLKQSFIYMLVDPRISCNLPGESVYMEKLDIWRRFLQSVFYVGKGKTSRPYSHLYDAMKTHLRLHNKMLQDKSHKEGQKISIKKQLLNVDLFKSPPTKRSDCKKLDRILDIWGHGNGVVCLHVFHNIVPTEAYTREAAIIDALSLQHLTNCKRGDYYGPSQSWTMKEKKYLGIGLLYKAMQIYLAEGESQLSPSDLI